MVFELVVLGLMVEVISLEQEVVEVISLEQEVVEVEEVVAQL